MFCPNPGFGLNKTRVCPTPYPHRHAPGSQNCPFTDPLFSFRVRRALVTHGLLRDAILNFQGKSSGSEVASRSDQKRIIKPAYS